MKLWKRNTVISCIVLFVCVALYLSWSYGRTNDTEAPVFDPGAQTGESLLEAQGSAPDEEQDPGSTQGRFDNYFSETRLVRKQARDSALGILNQAAENTDASQAVLDNVTQEIERLAKNAMSEASIETLVRAKGFEDCVAFINQDGIKIVVTAPMGGLTATDAAKIKDIVLSESDIAVVGITLVPVEG